MLKKTFDKLLKKESAKPLHCIDTSVFLESLIDSRLGGLCKSHINNMGKGKYFRGVMSVSVLGEINLIIFRDIDDRIERIDLLDALESFVRLRDISFVAPQKDDYLLIHELMDIETRLDELDSEHIVCAKRAGANAFITLDEKLIVTQL